MMTFYSISFLKYVGASYEANLINKKTYTGQKNKQK